MQNIKREKWIDNLKLMASIAVFWGHFYSSFYGQLRDPSFLSRIDATLMFVVQHVFSIFFKGGWWVFVFCIISGWLAWKKEIDSFKKLTKTLVHRYLRFVVPVLVANIFVVFINKTIGFHSFEVGTSINNEWLAANYSDPPQITHILISALKLNNEFVGPLWILRYIFVGTCIIYCLKYLAGKCQIDNDNACWVLLVGWPVFYAVMHKYGTSWFYSAVTASGVLLSLIKRPETGKKDKRKDGISGIGLAAIVVSMDYWVFDQLWSFITAWLFVSLSIRCEIWQDTLSNCKAITRTGHLSFTIYLLHCPLLYSVSMLIYKGLTNAGLPYSFTSVINLMASTIIVIVVSEIYYLIIQKRIDLLINTI